jgi:type II secretory pathway pseudopilin PulG
MIRRESRADAGSGARKATLALTLVELLVVFCILSVLMGLVLVAVVQGRFSARASSCLSGLRQLSLGATLYANDFGDSWPLPDRDASPYNTAPHINYIRQRPQAGFAGGKAGLGDLYPRYVRPELYYCLGHRNGQYPIDFTSGPDGEGNLGWRGWRGTRDLSWGHASTKANYLYRRRKGYVSVPGENPSAVNFRVDKDPGQAMIVDYPWYFSGVWVHTRYGVNHEARGVNVVFRDASVRWRLTAGTRLANPAVMDNHNTGAWWQDLDR